MDQRLGFIKEMVLPCGCAYDIGADHGYLVCALVEEGIARRGVATDIHPLPLKGAQEQIASRGLEARISTRLTDGLEGLCAAAGDAVVIAGMGGELIARILASWPGRCTRGVDYYLQPMTKPERLREYLYQGGFRLLEERCCLAGGHAYSVLHLRYTGEPEPYSPADLYLGRIDPGAGEAEAVYCKRLVGRLTKKQLGLAAGGAEQPQLDYWEQILCILKRRLADAGMGSL